jgi:hypothetical protein
MRAVFRLSTRLDIAGLCALAALAAACSFDTSQLRALPDGAVENLAVPDAPIATGGSDGSAASAFDAPTATGGSGGTTALSDAPTTTDAGGGSTGRDGAAAIDSPSGVGGIGGVGGTTSSGDSGGAGGSGSGRDAGVPDAPGAQPDVPIGGTGGVTSTGGLASTGGIASTGGACNGGANTTISGVIYDPAGLNPLYNVIVSIPSAALDPISTGVSCISCQAQVSGQPISTALTDAGGHFVLNNVPWNVDFPLVMQIGKWRREITIPKALVTHQCADNPITETKPATLLRLPRNIHDGDNNGQYTSIPKIAIAAGNAQNLDNTTDDRLHCLLRRIGVDASEFTLPSGSGSVKLYNQSQSPDGCNQISGSTTTYPYATTTLWDDVTHLNQYDVILLNCGGSLNGGNPTTTEGQSFIPNPAAVDRMKAYLNAGGRVFAEHFHWAWIRSFTGSPNYPSTFGDVATWNAVSGTIGSTARDTLIDQSFPKGVAFASWLSNVGASTTPGHLTLSSAVKLTAIDQIKPLSQRWIYEPSSVAVPTGAAMYTHYFSFNTPVGAAETAQCGRFVYTALHVADAATTDFPGDPLRVGGGTTGTTIVSFPDCCYARTGLSPQEKALEFMIFDLSGCLQ